MSCYDTVYLQAKCPYCGYIGEFDFITKDIGNMLEHYYEGDIIRTQWRVSKIRLPKYMYGVTSCTSKECMNSSTADKHGNLFSAKIEIERDNAVGRIVEIRKGWWRGCD